MFSWNKIINALKRSRGNINPFTTFKPSGWKCYKTIGSYVSCAFIEIWSTWEVWRALKKLLRIFRALQTSRVLHISMNARWRMNQLLFFTSIPLLDSYALIGIKKTCFTSRVRERQADKNINWPTAVSRNEKIATFTLFDESEFSALTRKRKEEFLS